MQGYIYRTHNKVNGKMYIGKKVSSVFLGNTYLGSGKLINRAIRKYGLSNFYVELLEEVQDKDILNEREKFWINELNSIKDDKYYNLAVGGHGGDTKAGYSSEERKVYKKKCSDSLIKHFQKNPGSHKGEKNSMYGRIGKDNPQYGMKRTQETKNKMSKAGIGKIMSDSAKNKMSISKKGHPSIKGTKYMNDGINNFRIRKEDIEKKLQEGLVMGRFQNGNVNRGSRGKYKEKK